jgi:hypothetical protein
MIHIGKRTKSDRLKGGSARALRAGTYRGLVRVCRRLGRAQPHLM